MAFDWTTHTFSSLITDGALEIGDGYRAKNDELGGKGPIFLRAGHVSDSGIDFSGVDRFIYPHADRFGSKLSQVGDVVITTKGNSTGRVTFVTTRMPQFVYSPHLSYWRARPGRMMLPGFLKAWSRSQEFATQLDSLSRSTDMAPYLSLQDQRTLKITIPPMSVQQAISALAIGIDDRIDHNHALAANLEAISRALFKSWFVDFDPVRAKAAGEAPPGLAPDLAALFPDRFVDSELGEIPEGWRVAPLTSFADLDTTSVKPFDDPETQWTHFSIPAFDEGRFPAFESGGQIASNKYQVRPGSVLVSKLNPTQWRCWRPASDLVSPRSICSTEFMQFVPPADQGEFLWGLCESSPFRDLVLTTVDGTTGSRQRAKPKDVARGALVLADDRLKVEYSNVVRPLLQRADASILEARALTQLRDLLLPRLISGKLRVEQAEQLAEGIA